MFAPRFLPPLTGTGVCCFPALEREAVPAMGNKSILLDDGSSCELFKRPQADPTPAHACARMSSCEE